VVFLCQFTTFTREPPWRASLLLPPFQSATIWLGQQVPPSVREHFHPAAMSESLRGKLDPAAMSNAVREHLDPAVISDALHGKLGSADPSGALRKPLPATISTPGAAPAPAATVSPSNHP